MKAKKSDSGKTNLSPIASSNKIFRLLVENSSDVLTLVNAHGIIIYSSPSIKKVLGYKDSERIGQSIFDHFHPDDLPRLKNIFGQLLQSPGSIANEIVRCQHKNGEWRWMEGDAMNLLAEPDVQAIVVNYRDISKRKHFEAELDKKSRALNERIKELDCINNVFEIFEETGLDINESLKRIINIIPVAMQYPELAQVRIQVQDIEVNTSNFRETEFLLAQDILINSKRVGTLEVCYLKLRDKNKKIFFLEEERSLIKLISSKIGQFIERKQAEKSILDERNFSNAILNSLPGVVYCYNKDLQFLRWNKNFENVLGYTSDEIADMKPLDFFEGSEQSLIASRIQEVFSKGISDAEANLVTKDGRKIPYYFTGIATEIDRVPCLVGVGIDISERTRAYKALHESEHKYRELVENANSIIMRWTCDGKIIFMNEFGLRFFGYTENELYGCHVIGTIVPETESTGRNLRPLMRNICADPKAYENNINENMCRNGERVWVNWTNKTKFSKEGELIEILSIGTDVTERRQTVMNLRESEERFKYVVKATSDAIWDWNLETDKLWWSEGIKNLFGFDPEEMGTNIQKWVDRIHPDDKQRVESGIYQVINSGREDWKDEYRFVRNDGTYAYVEDRGFVIHNQQGKAIRMVGGITDVTERINARERIIRLNRLYKMLSGINTLIVHVKDRQELFDGACRIAVEDGEFIMAWIGILPPGEKYVVPQSWAGQEDGYLQHVHISSDENDPGKNSTSSQALRLKKLVVHEIDADNNRQVRWNKEALSRGYRSVASLPLIISGEAVGVMAIFASVPDAFDNDEIKLLTEISGDISYALKNIMQREKLEFLASYDPLTGLANQALFSDHLNSVLQRARKNERKVALLVCDPRQFRNINNVYGREAGDFILQESAIRLRKLISDPVNLGRITGDYFAMILHDVGDSTGIAYMFENFLFPTLNKPYVFDATEIQISFSGGIAVFPSDGNDAETLYRNAEAASRKAKISGEQYLFYQPEMTARITETLHMENRLRSALKNDQFVLHYQPKIDSVTRNIIGFEALIRWNDPETGLVPPGKFIPILEETGLILDVGLWALEKAAADYRQWTSEFGSIPRISVNVSSLQLQQKNFVDQVETSVRKGGQPIPMDLEITESLIMTDINENISKLEAIRIAGFGIDIDDFGTGYSSLSYIAKLPVDALKIDRSFIANMNIQPESMTIVSTIINLAHSLNLKVIAEGVETEEQAKLLRLLKCNEMQGFLFSKPRPAKEIEGLLRAGEPL